MKLDINPKLTKEQIGEFEELTFDISDEDKGLLLAAFADGIYSQKIDSLVREIVSNAVDSHTEAGTDEPVIVTIVDNFNEQPYLQVIDKGVGISPERIVNVFVNYFKSTKRDSNLQIGGYGIGAKSPLSYTDLFYVETIYDGIEYNYVVHKGTTESLLPKMVLASKEATDQPNGTSISVPIKSRSDIDKFKEAIRRQLAYFHGVYFKGVGIDNDFTLYQGDNFYYRSKDQPTDLPHISLGGVYYPINWDAVGSDLRQYTFPIALTFEVGELTVTMNREQLEYREDAVTKIREKFEAVKKELGEMIKEQVGEMDNPSAVVAYQKSRTYYVLKLPNEASLTVPNAFVNANDLLEERYVPLGKFYDDKVIQAMPFMQGCINAAFKITHVLRGERMNKPRQYETPWMLLADDEEKYVMYLRRSGTQMSRIQKKYLETLHLGKAIYFLVVKPEGIFHDYKQSHIGINWGEAVNAVEDPVEKTKLKNEFIEALSKNIIDWYTKDMQYADQIVVPESFKDTQIVDNTLDMAALRKANNEFLVHRLQDYATEYSVKEQRWNPEKATFNQMTVTVADLEEPELIVWGLSTERDSLLIAKSVLSYLKEYKQSFKYRYGADLGDFAVIYVAQDNMNLARNLANSLHVNDFLMGKHTTIQKVATAVLLRDKIHSYRRVALKGIHDYSYEQLKSLQDYIWKYGDYGNHHLGKELEDELVHVLKENNLLDDEIIEEMDEFDQYMKGVELLKYITSKDDLRSDGEKNSYREAAAAYLITNNKHVNKQYYEHNKRNEAGGDLPAGGDRRAVVSQNHEDAESSDGDLSASGASVKLAG